MEEQTLEAQIQHHTSVSNMKRFFCTATGGFVGHVAGEVLTVLCYAKILKNMGYDKLSERLYSWAEPVQGNLADLAVDMAGLVAFQLPTIIPAAIVGYYIGKYITRNHTNEIKRLRESV